MTVFIDAARSAHARGDHATALENVAKLYRAAQKVPELPPFPGGIQEADRLLEHLGRDLWEKRKGGAGRPLRGDLVLATMLYPGGGHTAVIRDLAVALPEPPCALWLTMAHPSAGSGITAEAIERTGLSPVCRQFDGSPLWESACRLVSALSELLPARIFLLHHPDDCVAVVVAAAAAAMGSSLYLLHHADGTIAAGLYLSGVRIIDFTPRACLFTRAMLNRAAAWLPLTCPDPGVEPFVFMASGKIRTAVSGGKGKVEEMSDPDYPELVAAILTATGGTHVHIGRVSEKLRKRVHARLSKQGIAAERLIWLPHAPTLVQALREQQIDLVINTYPRGGARTAVEVMAAGRPMLWRSPFADLDHVRAQMKYPSAVVWRQPGDLLALLATIDGAWLLEQSAAARRWYAEVHHPQQWADFFAAPETNAGRSLPDGLTPAHLLREILEHAIPRRSRPKSIWSRFAFVCRRASGT